MGEERGMEECAIGILSVFAYNLGLDVVNPSFGVWKLAFNKINTFSDFSFFHFAYFFLNWFFHLSQFLLSQFLEGHRIFMLMSNLEFECHHSLHFFSFRSSSFFMLLADRIFYFPRKENIRLECFLWFHRYIIRYSRLI